MVGIYTPGYMVGIHPWVCTPCTTLGIPPVYPAHRTRHDARTGGGQLAALRRGVAELNISDEAVTVAHQLFPFHCWSVIEDPEAQSPLDSPKGWRKREACCATSLPLSHPFHCWISPSRIQSLPYSRLFLTFRQVSYFLTFLTFRSFLLFSLSFLTTF